MNTCVTHFVPYGTALLHDRTLPYGRTAKKTLFFRLNNLGKKLMLHMYKNKDVRYQEELKQQR